MKFNCILLIYKETLLLFLDECVKIDHSDSRAGAMRLHSMYYCSAVSSALLVHCNAWWQLWLALVVGF